MVMMATRTNVFSCVYPDHLGFQLREVELSRSLTSSENEHLYYHGDSTNMTELNFMRVLSNKSSSASWSDARLLFRRTDTKHDTLSNNRRVQSSTPDCVAHLFPAKTPDDYDKILALEGSSYKQSPKFKIKIGEADEQWNNPAKRHGGRFGAIHHYLEVLLQDRPDADVLELGFGAGTNMIVAQNNLKGRGSVWGIELTEGWVEHAQRTFKHEKLHFFQGDITRAASILSSGGAQDQRFDLIFLADVWEHIPAYRIKNTWETVVTLLKPKGRLYVHIPDEQTQMMEQRKKKGQYFEQIVGVEDFTKGAECFGMKVLEVKREKLGYVSIVAGFPDDHVKPNFADDHLQSNSQRRWQPQEIISYMTSHPNRANFVDLFRYGGFKSGVEVGVAAGRFSEHFLLHAKPERWIMVEPFPQPSLASRLPVASAHGVGKVKREIAETWEKRGIGKGTNIVFLKHFSIDKEVLAAIPPNSVDFVYLDGAHDYANVKLELEPFLEKVRPGGVLAGHDYQTHGFDFKALACKNCDPIPRAVRYTDYGVSMNKKSPTSLAMSQAGVVRAVQEWLVESHPDMTVRYTLENFTRHSLSKDGFDYKLVVTNTRNPSWYFVKGETALRH